MNRSKSACVLTLNRLAEGRKVVYLWTFTRIAVDDLAVSVAGWKRLRDECIRIFGARYFTGVRVFELHEEHGLHVHFVTNRLISSKRMWAVCRACGWGNVDVRRIPASEVGYVAKYLDMADRPGCFAGRRLWATVGAFEGTRCKDVVGLSPFSECMRQASAALRGIVQGRAAASIIGALATADFLEWCLHDFTGGAS